MLCNTLQVMKEYA